MLITTLRAAQSGFCSKHFTKTKDGFDVQPYSRIARWDIEPVEVEETVEGLHAFLAEQSEQTNTIVVTGVPKDNDKLKNVYRRKEGSTASLKDGRLGWMCFDIDGVDVAGNSPKRQLETFIQKYLPPVFHDVSYVGQLTSSAGIKDGLNARAWFVLTQPIHNTIQRQIAMDFNKYVDVSIYLCQQPIYVNNPTFSGMSDPVEGSRLWVSKRGADKVPLHTIDGMEGYRARAQDVNKGALAIKDWKPNGDPREVEQVCERLRTQRTVGGRHQHALAAAYELIGYGAEPNVVAAEVEGVIRRGGRLPQAGEVSGIVRAAVTKAAAGSLVAHAPRVGEVLDAAPTSDEQADQDDFDMLVEDVEEMLLDPFANSNDENENAAIFLKTYIPGGEAQFIICDRGEFLWNGHLWENLKVNKNLDMLKTRVKKLAGATLTSQSINKVCATLRQEGGVNATPREGGWVDTNRKDKPEPQLLMPNGAVNVEDAIIDPSLALVKPTPDRFHTAQFGFNYDPQATCPLWLDSLQQWFPGDPDSVYELQKMFGYLMVRDNRYEKMFVLEGSQGRNGKGTVNTVLRAMLGTHNWCALSLKAMAETFGLQEVGKKRPSVVFIDEVNHMPKNGEVAIDVIKAITGNDPVAINTKFGDIDSSDPIDSRFVMSFNKVPEMKDSSGALASRLHVFHFGQTFKGRENFSLKDELLAELPGIFNWAIEGLGYLRMDGRFFNNEATRKVTARIIAASSPLDGFIHECVEKSLPTDQEYCVTIREMFEAFEQWREANHVAHDISYQVFKADIESKIPHVEVHKHHNKDAWHGIRLNSEAMQEIAEQNGVF